MKNIKVAAAIIVNEDKIFATQRGYGPFKGGWEFPGGKIEEGETAEEALVREMQEELDVTIVVGDMIKTVEYDYPEFHLSMDCFVCRLEQGSAQPTLKEHQAARWLKIDELYDVEWLPADITLIDYISVNGISVAGH